MSEQEDRLEEWKGRTLMVFCAHPDDEIQISGTLALLVKNGNRVIVVLYTNGNKGTQDLEMTSERLAAIRKQEEEAASALIGIPSEDILWLGYDDGELEYADRKTLCGRAARLLRLHRPDTVFCFDPGRQFEQWHKTDHRTAAFNTVDAARAAAYHLYYPEHLLYEGLKPFRVREFFYFGSHEPNYEVDVSAFYELRLRAGAAHVSQRGAAQSTYAASPTAAEKKALEERIQAAKGQKQIERFRRGGTSY
ncbi:MAG: PIG-L family deacetylase [Kiritimatiellae bacterium]|nr:PIG-L family deacetylase [Kiritimatiellia bacterium]